VGSFGREMEIEYIRGICQCAPKSIPRAFSLPRIRVLSNVGIPICRVRNHAPQHRSIVEIDRVCFLDIWPIRLMPWVPFVAFVLRFLLLCPTSSILGFSFLPLALLFLSFAMVLPVLLSVLRIPGASLCAGHCPLLLRLLSGCNLLLLVV
jgi:hypothetical protein